jgi:hypothetical protein
MKQMVILLKNVMIIIKINMYIQIKIYVIIIFYNKYVLKEILTLLFTLGF